MKAARQKTRSDFPLMWQAVVQRMEQSLEDMRCGAALEDEELPPRR